MANVENVPVKRRITELKVVDLRQELEKRGLDKYGVKAVLIEKLQTALIEEGTDPNEIVIDSQSGASGVKGASRKGTPSRRSAGKPNEEHEEQMEEIDTDDLMDGEFLQVDSTGDQSMDGLSQEGLDASGEYQDVMGKIDPESIIDSVEGEMDDMNDDVIHITAEDDQLLTEDETLGDQAEEMGAATDSSGVTSGGAGEMDTNKEQSGPVSQPAEKQEVDSESLVVHVDDPSLLELDADLTKPEGKSANEESGVVADNRDAQKAMTPGKEKWELETQEKKDEASTNEQSGNADDSSGGIEPGDAQSADMDSAGDKQDSLSSPSSESQRRSSTSSGSGKPGSEKERKPGSGRVGRNLWVCNLSKTTRAADLKAAFSKYGKVAGAKVVTNARSPGTLCYGFVMMSASSEAQRAMNHLHRTELHGRTIHVEWAGNDPVPGGRKPPLIPPSLLAAEKEKEKEREKEKEKENAKEEAKPSAAVPVKAEMVEEKPVQTETEEPVTPPAAAVQSKSPAKTEDKKPEVKKEEESKESPKEGESKEKSEKDKKIDKKDILSFEKIKEQRDKERERNRERGLRENERRRERERQEQFRRQRDLLRRRTRDEEEKIRREREQLKIQRIQLEQERLERERLERERIRLQQERQREHERLERERVLNMQLRIEQEHRTALKRSMDARGMPMHEVDPYMGEQKRRMAMESGMIPPAVIVPPQMDVPGGMMNNQRGPDVGGERRFDRRDRRDDQGGRFGGGRFRDNRNQRNNERGPPGRREPREDTRKEPPRRDDSRREEPRRPEQRRSEPRREDARRDVPRRDESRREDSRREPPRREEGRREDTRKEPPPRREPPQRREEPSRREEPARREEPSRRVEASRATANRREDTGGFQRRDDREGRGNVPQRPEVPRRAEPPRRDTHQAGRFSGNDKDERRVIATTGRNERFEGPGGRAPDNQFGNQQGNTGFQDRRRVDRERERNQPDFRNRDADRERGNFTQERGRYDGGGDSHFQRRSSPPARGRENWKQDHVSNTDTRRVSGNHDTWKQNEPLARPTSDRRVELRTVETHHPGRPENREIIEHGSSFNRGRITDYQQNMASDNSAWNSGTSSRPIGSFNDRPILDDSMQRHSGGSDISAPMMGGQSNNWNAGRRDQGLNSQQDRWGGGSSLGGLSSSLASGMTQSSQPLNTMLGSGGSNFGGINTNALGNLINSMNASAGTSGFSLDRHLMQTDSRFDSIQSSQGTRRF